MCASQCRVDHPPPPFRGTTARTHSWMGFPVHTHTHPVPPSLTGTMAPPRRWPLAARSPKPETPCRTVGWVGQPGTLPRQRPAAAQRHNGSTLHSTPPPPHSTTLHTQGLGERGRTHTHSSVPGLRGAGFGFDFGCRLTVAMRYTTENPMGTTGCRLSA